MGRPRKPLDLSTYRARCADRLVKLREKKGLHADVVVESLQNLGLQVSRSSFYRTESGTMDVDLNLVPALAELYGVTPRGLFPEK
jgi:transcriptional regulator with XRE-family HTH domain